MSDIGNVNYTFSDDGIIGYGHLSDGTIFMFDADLFSRIKDIKWYVSYKSRKGRQIYIVDCHVDRCIKCFLVQEKEWSWIISILIHWIIEDAMSVSVHISKIK